MLKNLEKVLKVRKLLEEKAMAHTYEVNQQLNTAIAEFEQAKQKLADYRTWREQREAEMLSQLKAGPCPASDVSTYRDNLQTLATDESGMMVSITEGERRVGEIQVVLEEVRLAQIAAVRSREKMANIIELEKGRQMGADIKKEDEENDEISNLCWGR